MREEMLSFYKSRFFYPGLIFIVWLLAYVLCQLVFEQKLGWDEVSYLSVAKGIATNFDFSSRAYTIMGLLKHGYPSHLINYPISSLYIAIFFKLFGCSLKIAYFSSWLAALGVSTLIFYIFKLLFPGSNKFSFILAISYLFYPGILKNIDSAMMEQLGNFLLTLSIYLIFKDYVKSVFGWGTVLKLSFSLLILWLYKTLFIGMFFGFFASLLFMSFSKKVDFKIKPLFFISSVYLLFAILFCTCQKFLFLPVAPMMNFTPDKEARQIYSDFLGGFFLDFPDSLINNLQILLKIIETFFVYPFPYIEPESQFFVFIPFVIIIGGYFFVLSAILILTFAFWKSLDSIQKTYMIFSLTSILIFNLIFNCLFSTTYENMWRYNLYYVPLFILALGVVLKKLEVYVIPFYKNFKTVSILLLMLLFIGFYLPPSLSIIKAQNFFYDQYHGVAKTNTDVVKYFLRGDKPEFVYFNNGTHVTWELYPMKLVFKDATNEQLIEVNKILPQSIKYLFLSKRDWLYQHNESLILKESPIIDNKYIFYGYDPNFQIFVYKLAEGRSNG